MGEHRVVEADDPGEPRLAGSQPDEQVVTDLGLHRPLDVTAGAKLAQSGLAGWTHAIDITSRIPGIAPCPPHSPARHGVLAGSRETYLGERDRAGRLGP
ncbi:hypothetical protein GCM10010411_43340 [Actinomadura fulvescens]|uniref:Uncharacterized protein n=1 Tax=Actinomadura fulvescens TaxID=46160 RepID=A0ABP6CBJ6_9ACTN